MDTNLEKLLTLANANLPSRSAEDRALMVDKYQNDLMVGFYELDMADQESGDLDSIEDFNAFPELTNSAFKKLDLAYDVNAKEGRLSKLVEMNNLSSGDETKLWSAYLSSDGPTAKFLYNCMLYDSAYESFDLTSVENVLDITKNTIPKELADFSEKSWGEHHLPMALKSLPAELIVNPEIVHKLSSAYDKGDDVFEGVVLDIESSYVN